MKKIFLILCLFILNSCADEKVYKVGISPDYPPFDMIVDGKLSGFDVELISALAKLQNIKISFSTLSFDALIPALKAGKIDLIASGMTSNEQRKKSVDFSDTYYFAKTSYIKNKKSSLSNIDDIKGKKVGVQLGSIQEFDAKKLGAKIVSNQDPIALILMLNNNKLDAVALDALVADEFIKKNENLVEFVSVANEEEGMQFAVNKGKNQELLNKLNQALSEFKNTNEFKDLCKKYGIK